MGRRDDLVQHGELRLITMVVIDAEENDDNKAFIYCIKERKKRIAGWYIRQRRFDVKTLDADYKDSLQNQDITNIAM